MGYIFLEETPISYTSFCLMHIIAIFTSTFMGEVMAVVVLTEKPSVGRDIARVLGANRRGQGFLEGNGYVVTWAFGHLVELMEPDDYDASLKSWSLKTLPIIPETFKLKVSKGKGISAQLQVIKRFFKDADSIICATDAGREGELIFRYILELCRCKSKPVKRLWISSMTDQAIREGFNTLKPLADYDALAAAARCRSQADWIVGLNATRGYTVQHSHGRGVFSVGRVQTPVLALIVKRDQEIRDFKPEDYWELWTKYREVNFKHVTDRFKKKEEGEILLKKVEPSSFTIIKIEKKKQSQPPPQLFDLTELQRTMNRNHGYSATQTLKICQELYEKKWITYPRTDSRYLTDDLYGQCKATLQKLRATHAEKIEPIDINKPPKSKRFFNAAKVTDHHAIIPTGQIPQQLDREDGNVYHAIVTRFIAAFYPHCEKAHTTVTGMASSESFKAKGTQILSPGWLSLYQSDKKQEKDEEQVLPSFTLHEEGPHAPFVKTCRTKPPGHHTEATLLSAMETAGKSVDDEELKEAMKERGLGTPATRASIIEILFKREYIRKEKKKLLASPKGEELIRLVNQQPTLSSAEMTAEWEYRLKQVEKGAFQAADFMKNICQFTVEMIGQLKDGGRVDSSNLGQCPLCSKPVIKGNTGFGCSAWKEGCTFRFHAQQFGTTINEKDVPQLLARGRLSYPRNLMDTSGQSVRGYVTIDASGTIGMITAEEKMHQDSIGKCPQCSGGILEKHPCYSCMDCDFVIWKKIAGKSVSVALAQVLLSKGKSQVLKGFRSKAGKPFSASLKLEGGKVVMEFPKRR
jgi:DNA topoisomerase III